MAYQLGIWEVQPGEAPSSGGSPREGVRSELASGAATGGGGPQAPPTQIIQEHQ